MRATCLAYLILLYLYVLIIFGKLRVSNGITETDNAVAAQVRKLESSSMTGIYFVQV
jgi:hypothetical protein